MSFTLIALSFLGIVATITCLILSWYFAALVSGIATIVLFSLAARQVNLETKLLTKNKKILREYITCIMHDSKEIDVLKKTAAPQFMAVGKKTEAICRKLKEENETLRDRQGHEEVRELKPHIVQSIWGGPHIGERVRLFGLELERLQNV